MILDLIQKIIGVLPQEYEFIYYILTIPATLAMIMVIFIPFAVVFRSVYHKKGGFR